MYGHVAGVANLRGGCKGNGAAGLAPGAGMWQRQAGLNFRRCVDFGLTPWPIPTKASEPVSGSPAAARFMCCADPLALHH